MTRPPEPHGPPPRAPRGLGKRRGRTERLIFLSLGWVFLVLGAIGGLIPFIQGWPLGILGAAILYLESRSVQRWVYRWRKRHPGQDRAFNKARAFLKGRARKRREKRARRAG